MYQRIFLITVTLFILACSALLPQKTEPTASLSAPTEVRQTEAVTTATGNSGLIGYKEVRLHPQDGALEEILAIEAAKAISSGFMPVVEFDADWCPPCIAIQKYLNAKNELMLNAYDGTYIIKLDVDEWGWDNGRVENFFFEAIPVYFKLDGQGQQTGEVIDGGAWNEDIPVNIAPVMDTFFHAR